MIGLIVALVAGAFSTPKAHAIDPVTIAILAPIAIKAAQVAAPYVIRGLKSGGVGLIKVGADALKILLLPLGILQCTILAPFGGLSSGLPNIAQGAVAPFTLVMDTILLPIRFCGVGI